MKNFMSIFFAAFLMLWGLSAVAEAKAYYNPQPQRNINRRQRRQQTRIRRGYWSGRLTRREAARLEWRQRRLNRTERRFRKSGGGLS